MLPGVGEKTAYRYAFHILQHNTKGGVTLANALLHSIEHIRHCSECRTLTTEAVCSICANDKRDNSKLCVVKNPLDIASIEKTGSYSGKYFVLGNYISPIDRIGPEDLHLELLENIAQSRGVSEIILATSATLEGEITNTYISNLFSNTDITVTQLVRGIPLGGDLEYTDINTLTKALNDRH